MPFSGLLSHRLSSFALQLFDHGYGRGSYERTDYAAPGGPPDLQMLCGVGGILRRRHHYLACVTLAGAQDRSYIADTHWTIRRWPGAVLLD